MTIRGYSLHLIQVLQSIYKGTKIAVNVEDRITDTILVNQGARQGCSLTHVI